MGRALPGERAAALAWRRPADWFYLEQNQYQPWPPGTTFEVQVPGQHQTTLALPWGGTCHPVWFKDDPRVANCKIAGGVSPAR